MKLLRALFSFFRRPARAADAYEAEVLFAGWVEMPPLFRELADRRPPVEESKRAISA